MSYRVIVTVESDEGDKLSEKASKPVEVFSSEDLDEATGMVGSLKFFAAGRY